MFDGDSVIKAFSVSANITHFDYAFAVYRITRKKQQENIANDSYVAYLSFALTSLPNIRKIVLTDSSSSRSMPFHSLKS